MRFLNYLCAALETIQAGLGISAAILLEQPQPTSFEPVLTAILNEIARLEKDLVVVLEDMHTLSSPVVFESLTFLLNHAPTTLHLVILTRSDPPLPLSRLRARGQLVEIRTAELRFTYAEIATLLNNVMNIQLLPEDLAVLEKRTEGWIAGLQLTALSMQGRDDIQQFIGTLSGSHHYILDYLGEEVLQRQPEFIRSFLLQTSILERMCRSLCDHVIENLSPEIAEFPCPAAQNEIGSRSQTMIDALERANLFLIPLDEEGRWVRYHPLFADILRQRLFQLYTQEEVKALHLRAGDWFEQHDLIPEAITHYMAASLPAEAVRLLSQHAMPLFFNSLPVRSPKSATGLSACL